MPVSVSIASGCLTVLVLFTFLSLLPFGPAEAGSRNWWMLLPLGIQIVLIVGLSKRKSVARWTAIALSVPMFALMLGTAVMMLDIFAQVDGNGPPVPQGFGNTMAVTMAATMFVPVALLGVIIVSLFLPSAGRWCNK